MSDKITIFVGNAHEFDEYIKSLPFEAPEGETQNVNERVLDVNGSRWTILRRSVSEAVIGLRVNAVIFARSLSETPIGQTQWVVEYMQEVKKRLAPADRANIGYL